MSPSPIYLPPPRDPFESILPFAMQLYAMKQRKDIAEAELSQRKEERAATAKTHEETLRAGMMQHGFEPVDRQESQDQNMPSAQAIGGLNWKRSTGAGQPQTITDSEGNKAWLTRGADGTPHVIPIRESKESQTGLSKNIEYETTMGIDPKLRGTPEYQKGFFAYQEKTKSQPGMGMFAGLPQQSQDAWYETYINKGIMPPFAYRDAASRNSFTKGFAEYLERQGISATDAIVNKAQIDALGGSLKNQQKIKGMMGSFATNLEKQVDRLDSVMGDLVKRTGTRAVDLPMRKLKTEFKGSGAENIVTAYLTEISNEIGKLSTGSAASIRELSVEAQKIWSKIHDPNLSMKELHGLLAETKQMAKMRMDSTQNEIDITINEMHSLEPGKKGKKTKGSSEEEKPTSQFKILKVE